MTTLLVTGATRGLGLATAKAARGRGAQVICAGRGAEQTRALLAEAGALG